MHLRMLKYFSADSAKKYENLSDDMKKFIKEEEFNQLNKICTGELEKVKR